VTRPTRLVSCEFKDFIVACLTWNDLTSIYHSQYIVSDIVSDCFSNHFAPNHHFVYCVAANCARRNYV